MAEEPNFPYPVTPPYSPGWEQALTMKYGMRGRKWTSIKSDPQWTVHFKDADAAAWFKQNWRRNAQ